MKHHLVYLAGPITGLKWDEATDWREKVRHALKYDSIPVSMGAINEIFGTDTPDYVTTVPSRFQHIHTLSPLRGKQYLEKRSSEDGAIMHSYSEYPLSSAKGINTRDHWDVMRCDVLFVNLLGAQTVSIGTVMEIAWGWAYKKPTILVMEKTGNIHEHSMIQESIGFRTDSLDEGIEILKAICGPDNALLTD